MPAAAAIAAIAIGTGVATTIGAAVGAAIVGSAISATAATAIGAGIISGTVTAISGGSASDVLKSAVLGGVSSYAGGLVGDYVGSSIASATGVELAGTVVGNVASGITRSVITGQDIEVGALAGLAASVPAVLKATPGFSELPKAAQNAIVASAATAVQGGNIENALVNSVVMSSNIVGKAVSNIPGASEYFKKPENADTFRVVSATVNSAISAAVQGKPVNAAVNKALINSTTKILENAINSGINSTVSEAKQKYTAAQTAENVLKANIEKYESVRASYNEIVTQVQYKSKLREDYIAEYEKFKSEHEQGQGVLSVEQLNVIAGKANAALENANKTTEGLNSYYEANKDNLSKFKTELDKYAELQPKLEADYNKAVESLDTTSKKIVAANTEIAKTVDNSVNTEVKNIIAKAGSGSYNEDLKTWTLPDVIVYATKDPEGNQWQSATADNGWEIAWNETKGIIELYDPNVSVVDPVKVYTGKWGDGAKTSTGVFDQMSYFIDTAKDSFIRSSKQTGSLLFDVLPGMVAKAAGNENYFNSQMSQAAKTLQEINARYPERVASYKDIGGFKDALTYGVEAVTSAVVTTVPTLLMGGAAGVAARASVKTTIDNTLKQVLAEQAAKGVTGAAAMKIAQEAATKAAITTASKFTVPAILVGSASQNIPEVFQNVYNAKDGKVDLTDVAVSTLVGSFNAALDSVLPSALVDKLNLSKIPVEEVIGAWYKNVAKEAGSAFLKEGGTEALQEISSAAAETFLADNKDFFTRENLDRFVDAGLKGAIGGSAISTSIAVGQEIASGLKDVPTNTNLYNQGLDNTTPTEYNQTVAKFKQANFNYDLNDIAAVTGAKELKTVNEINTAVDAYMDPRVVDREEILAAARAEGIALTDEQIAKYIGQKDEASTIASARQELDPLGTTRAEAEALFKDTFKYTPSTTELNQFIKDNFTEAQARTDIGAYVDPRQVTREEAINFFKQTGYTPTEQELATYIKQGPTVEQAAIQKLLTDYVDPRYVDYGEAVDALKAAGITRPSPEDVYSLIGQYQESQAAQKVAADLDKFRFNSLQYQIGQLSGVDLEAQFDTFADRISGEIARAEAAGLSRDQAINVALDKVAGDLKYTREQLIDELGITEDALRREFTTGIAGLDLKIEGVGTKLEQLVKANEAAGMTRDQALSKAINDVAVDLGVTKEGLLSQLGTTEANLRQEFTTGFERLDEKIVGVGSKLEKLIAANEAAGMSRDQALSKALTDVATDLGTTKENLLTQLGTTETALRTEFTTGLGRLEERIVGVSSKLEQLIKENEAAGMSRDEALSKALADVASDLGTTKDDLLKQLGTTEAGLREEFTAGLAGVSADLQTKYNALTAEQKALAAQLAQQGVDLATAINTAKSELSSDLQTKYNALTAEQKALANQLTQQGVDLTTAINTAKGELETQIGLTQQQIQKVADFVGKPYRDVTQADVEFVNTVIAQQQTQPGTALTPQQLAYDINQDSKIDQADLTILQSILGGTGEQPFVPGAGTIWTQQPTGVYGVLAQQAADAAARDAAAREEAERQRAAALTKQAQMAQQATQRQNVNTLMQMLGQAQDVGGQQVSVKTPDPAQIRYIYDIAGPSIFATPEQQRMFVTPYAQGGVVDAENDDVTAELLKILRS